MNAASGQGLTATAATSLLHLGERFGMNSTPRAQRTENFADMQVQFPQNVAAGTEGSHVKAEVGMSQGINMSMTTADASWKQHSRSFVKEVLFKKVKFWDAVNHGGYNTHPLSVCGMFAAKYTFHRGADPTDWWKNVRPLLIEMLTHHRNNIVKTIRNKYLGSCVC